MRVSCPEALLPELFAAMRLDGIEMASVFVTGPGWIFEFSLRQQFISAVLSLVDTGRLTKLPIPL